MIVSHCCWFFTKKYSFISLCLKPEMWQKVAKFKGAEYFRKALYIRYHSWQCMSEQNPSHAVEGILCRAPTYDCIEAQIWGRVPNLSAALKVPKNTVASIILKWKKFESTNTLPRFGCPDNLSTRGWRALVREGSKNLMAARWELPKGT